MWESCWEINGAAAVPLVAPRFRVRSVGPLKEFRCDFSCVQISDSSSLGERARCLAAVLDRLRRRRHRKKSARNAARASAPNVQPRTIGSVLEEPPPFLSAVAVAAAAAAAEEEEEPAMLDCAAAKVVGVAAAEALEAEVDVEEDDEELVLEDELLEVVLDDEELVVVNGLPSTDVTSVYSDCASEIRLVKLICAVTEVVRTALSRRFCVFIVLEYCFKARLTQFAVGETF